jgi:hypothetical protein
MSFKDDLFFTISAINRTKMFINYKFTTLCHSLQQIKRMSSPTPTPNELLQSAIASADIYHHGIGTTFLHIHNPLTENVDDAASNPTGAVVPSISLATTFRQSTPGEATAIDDPNSFGVGYEYSRTGV